MDTSDRTNSYAALSFLKEIEEQKRGKDEEAEEKDVKVTFNKSIKLKKKVEEEKTDNTEKSVARGSKILMPEYVIGQKIKKDKKKMSFGGRSSKNSEAIKSQKSSKELKLGHLMEEEDEEEDDDGMD